MDTKDNRIAVLHATLFIAMHPGEDPDAIHDAANMMLIPLQIKEGGTTLVDYAFDGTPYITGKTVGDYDYAMGMLDADLVPPTLPPQPAGSVAEVLSAEELDGLYNPNGNGEHPVWTRAEWVRAVSDETTVSGYWQWLADKLEDEGVPDVSMQKLLIAAVKSKMEHWDDMGRLEAAGGFPGGNIPDKASDELVMLIDNLAAGLDSTYDADRMIEQEHVDMVKKIFEDAQ